MDHWFARAAEHAALRSRSGTVLWLTPPEALIGAHVPGAGPGTARIAVPTSGELCEVDLVLGVHGEPRVSDPAKDFAPKATR